MQRPKTQRRAVGCCGCSGIYERKYELDSLANPLHLAAQYYAASQDMTPFQDDKWLSAVELTLSTMVGERDRFVPARYALDRLVVGRDSGADEAEGDGQPIEDVDPHLGAELLLTGLRRVIAGRAGADHRDVPHPHLPLGGGC